MANDLLVDVVPEEEVEPSLLRVIEQAAERALEQQGIAADAELTVLLVSDEAIRQLNREYRGIDAETDVLSFGMQEGTALALPEDVPRYLGDIAISVPRARSQAADFGHSVERELAFLTVHGVLHLLGHDHHDPAEQRRMRDAEEAVLARLHLTREGP